MIFVQENHMVLRKTFIAAASCDIFQSSGKLLWTRLHGLSIGFILVTFIGCHSLSHQLASNTIRWQRLEWPVIRIGHKILDCIPAEGFSRPWCCKGYYKSYNFFLLLSDLFSLFGIHNFYWFVRLLHKLGGLLTKSLGVLFIQNIAKEKGTLVGKSLILMRFGEVSQQVLRECDIFLSEKLGISLGVAVDEVECGLEQLNIVVEGSR